MGVFGEKESLRVGFYVSLRSKGFFLVLFFEFMLFNQIIAQQET